MRERERSPEPKRNRQSQRIEPKSKYQGNTPNDDAFLILTCKSPTTICIGWLCKTIVLIVVDVSAVAGDVDVDADAPRSYSLFIALCPESILCLLIFLFYMMIFGVRVLLEFCSLFFLLLFCIRMQRSNGRICWWLECLFLVFNLCVDNQIIRKKKFFFPNRKKKTPRTPVVYDE